MAFLEDEFKQMVNDEFSYVTGISYINDLATNVASNISEIHARCGREMSESDTIKFMALFGAMLNTKLVQSPEDNYYWNNSSIGC